MLGWLNEVGFPRSLGCVRCYSPLSAVHFLRFGRRPSFFGRFPQEGGFPQVHTFFATILGCMYVCLSSIFQYDFWRHCVSSLEVGFPRLVE